MKIRYMKQADIPATGQIHSQAFPRQTRSQEWIQASYNGHPRHLCFVIEDNDELLGYCIWAQKSGFRPHAVIELDQIGVLPDHQGKGVGTKLIKESLELVKEYLADNDQTLKHIMVTTRADNAAQRLYSHAFGAKVETTISNLYSADEVLMISRDAGERR